MIGLFVDAREVQVLHKKIRTNKEKLQCLEAKLRDIRKGKGNAVR